MIICDKIDNPKGTSMSTLKFANKLHPNLIEAGQNCFYSPFSLVSALGMVSRGSKGQTQKDFAKFLELPTNMDEQTDLLKTIIAETNKKKTDYELVSANALWAQKDTEFRKDYADSIKNDYQGVFEEVDYINAPKAAVDTINEWCKKNTKDKILEIINLSFIQKSTRLILTNAIYFKGKWIVQFDKKNTKDGNFSNESGTIQTPMMNLTDDFGYMENDKFQALEMVYEGGELSMVILLPLPSKNESFTASIDNNLMESYEQAVDNLRECKVVVSIPKFKVETKYELMDTFESMDSGLAFTSDADFTGIAVKEKLVISNIIHKAFVECDEEGTEAAAATAVGMMRCVSMRKPMPKKLFTADHPFVFFIRNRLNDNVLFCGRINNLK